VYDRDGKYLLWNQYMVEMTGLVQEAVLGKSPEEILPIFRIESFMPLLQQAMSGEIATIPDMEYVIPPTGKSGWLGGYCGPLRNAKGNVIGAIGVINDITERRKDNDALHSAIIEKEVLLREIHHRVKNNLQVMSSLISLQADTVDDENVQQMFLEMHTRLQTMAIIHEELYQAKNLSRVNLAEYIGKLATSLSQSFLLNPKVGLEVDVEEVFLGIDTAIPCGLIVNELVTNAFKYAFPDNQPGEVLIRLRSNAEGVYALTVKDNGVGLPSGLDIYRTETLGMQLITILAAQLGSKLDIELSEGTCFRVQFSEKWKSSANH
jgi:PAS domain S-box-containing protein